MNFHHLSKIFELLLFSIIIYIRYDKIHKFCIHINFLFQFRNCVRQKNNNRLRVFSEEFNNNYLSVLNMKYR